MAGVFLLRLKDIEASQGAVAKVLGVNEKTIRNDLQPADISAAMRIIPHATGFKPPQGLDAVAGAGTGDLRGERG